jgi:fatty acid desaturase
VTAPSLQRRPTGLIGAREVCRDLFAPDPRIYWADFAASAVAGWTALSLVVAKPGSVASWVAAPVAVLALYRALLFIHELTHLRREDLPGFALAWNVLAGIPMLLPSFTYVGVHTDHHKRTLYGTPGDPEYLPLALGPRRRVAWFLVESFFVPLLLFVRFVLVSPFGLLAPRLHKWLERHVSSLVINVAYRRREVSVTERRRMIASEVAMLLIWGAAFWSAARGQLPWRIFPVWYGVSAGIAFVNQVRTLAAHRFRNPGDEMDVVGQLTDTVNIPGGPLTVVWAPVGLRFHALHHWMPDLPYHALREAHRRLLEVLPSDAPYRQAEDRSLWNVIRTVWGEAAAGSNRGFAA